MLGRRHRGNHGVCGGWLAYVVVLGVGCKEIQKEEIGMESSVPFMARLL